MYSIQQNNISQLNFRIQRSSIGHCKQQTITLQKFWQQSNLLKVKASSYYEEQAGYKIGKDRLQQIAKSVKKLGRRVTEGDVSADTGLEITEAKKALLACVDGSAESSYLEVSEQGEIVYNLSPNFEREIQSKSFYLDKVQPRVEKLAAFGWQAIKVSYGATLFISIAVIYATIFIALSSQNENRDDRSSNRSSSSGFSPSFFISSNPFFTPYYSSGPTSRRAYQGTQKKEPGFIESIYYFVFGGDNPNKDFEDQKWRQVSLVIQQNDGVVVAEQLAPYLVTSNEELQSRDEIYRDENFVLPALLKFEGEPIVDSNGHILYKFPKYQTSAQQKDKSRQVNSIQDTIKEKLWPGFNDLVKQPQNGVLAILFGTVNLAGLLFLQTQILPQYVIRSLWIKLGFFVLQGYGFSFFAIPLLRRFVQGRQNQQITERNSIREKCLQVLRYDPRVQQKLKEAQNEVSRRQITEKDIIYSTNKNIEDYATKSEKQDFDEKLNKNQPPSLQESQQYKFFDKFR